MDYSTLTNDQINERLAVEVMEMWFDDGYWCDKTGIKFHQNDWNPAEDLNQTVMCADAMANMGWSWSAGNKENDHYWGRLSRHGNIVYDCISVITDGLTRALAEAILQAVDNG